MTPSDVRDRLDAIRGAADDPEKAHGLEDELRDDVLRAIALGAEDPKYMASLALQTRFISFPRWYA